MRKIAPIGLLIIAVALTAAGARAEVQTFGLISDVQTAVPSNLALMQSIQRSGIGHLAMAGDMMSDPVSSYDPIWAVWKHAGFVFDAVAHGNHFISAELEREYFGMPADYYTVVRGSIRFVVLTSEDESKVSEQARWLNQELSAATEPFIFVLFHRPPVTVSDIHPWTEKSEFQRAIAPVLQAYRSKVTAVVCGHVHVASILNWNGIPLILSSATAIPQQGVRPIKTQANGYSAETLWLNDQPESHWTRVDANPETGELWLNIVNVPHDRVECSAEIARGRFFMRDHCAATTTHRPVLVSSP